MTSRPFLRMLGLSPTVETERARRAVSEASRAVSAEARADERAFTRANKEASDSRWSIELGRTDGDTPYHMTLDDLIEISADLTAATGAGKSRFVGVLCNQVVRRSLAGAPVSVALVDGKGDTASEFLRGLARFAEDEATRTAILSRLRVLRVFDEDWLPSMPLLHRPTGIDATTIGHTLANTLCDAFGDASVGARQRALLAALLSVAVEQDIPFVALPWLLADLGAVQVLASRASTASLRLELARLPREGQATIDGVSARLNTLLEVPALRGCLSGPVPVAWTSMFEPGSLTVVDLGGAPLGAREGARVIGSLVISALVDATFDPSRRIRGRTWIVVDEPSALLTSTSAAQLERLVTLGRSFRTSTLLVHQSTGQLQADLRTTIDTNIAWRVLGRSSERDANNASEWFTRMIPPRDVESAAARDRWFVDMVGRLPERHFLVSDRRARFAPRRIEALPFNPPAWSSLSAATRDALRRGSGGFPRAELEGRAREFAARAEAAFVARQVEQRAGIGTSVPRRRRGVVP